MPLETPRFLRRLAEERTAGRAAAWATLAGLLVRVASAALFGSRLHWSDERAYFAHATRVAENQWLGPHGFTLIPPGQYYTLGLLFHATGPSLLAARLFQACLSAASVWLLYRLMRRFSPGAGALAAWMLALYPLAVYTAGTLYPQSLALFLLLGCLNLLSDHVQRPSLARAAAGGLCMGLTALTVPTVLTISPVVAAWLWWARRFRARALAEVAVVALVAAAAIAPWVARNYAVEKRFIPIATVGSQIFFFANNPNANPDCKELSILERVYTPEIHAEIARTGDENGVYFRHAMEFIRTQPGRALYFYVKRLGHFFDFYPTTFTRHGHNSLPARILVGMSSGPVLLLALLGAWPLLRRGGRLPALWVLVPLSWGLANAMFGVSIRYRVPVEPCILAVAAWTLWRFAFRMEESRHEEPAPGPTRSS